VVLLPSPLLGPATWRPVADRLGASGWETRCCPAPPVVHTTADVLSTFHAAVPPDRRVVLVAHSNAGLYVPSLSAGYDVVAAVFVDAGLPVERGSQPMAPPALVTFLASLADATGVLPPWTGWWDPADVDGLFPDPSVRRAVEREQPRLPLTYFEERLEVPDGWGGLACAYVAFGDTYAQERAEAVRRGWPVRTLQGGHLHMLMQPDAAAGVLVDVLQSLGVEHPRAPFGGSRRPA